jgi:7-cyano-7-deazaguanine synthase in queuosine biosynthesis
MFPLNNNKIALLFSGGVESVLIYYLVLQQEGIEDKIFNLYLIDKYDNPLQEVEKLYLFLKNNFNDNLTRLKILKYKNDTLEQNKIGLTLNNLNAEYDVMLYGINKYPDDISIRPVHKYNTFNEESIDNLYLKYPNIVLPFIDYTKDKIIKMYYDYKIENLLPLTLSCGNKNRVCGECFNCKERKWAYDKLKIKLDMGL